MRNKKSYKIFMIIACLVAVGLNAYRIIKGEYTGMEIFLVIAFLVFAGIYIYQLVKEQPK